MATITFDTLAYAKLLEDAGIEPEKAEAFAKAQKLALEEVFNSQELATKADIAKLEQATKADIARLEQKMSDMEVRIMRSTYNAMFGLVAAMCAIAAVVVAFLK